MAALDDMTRLKRYLWTYDDVTDKIVQCIYRLLENGRGKEVVQLVNDFCLKEKRSIAGRKLSVSVLAVCTTRDLATKQAVYDVLNEVCDSPPLLFQFLACVAKQTEKGKSGFGRVKRKAVARWYNSKSLKDLAVAVTRFRRRNNWSHIDLVRLAHTKPDNAGVEFILRYVTKGLAAAKQHSQETSKEVPDGFGDVIKYLEVVEKVKSSHDEQEAARMIEDHRLTYEHVPTWFIKNSNEVWRSLVAHMPLDEVLVHLNKMAAIGLLNSTPDGSADIFIKHLESDCLLLDSKIHPFSIQVALKSYEGGKAGRSTSTWTPNQEICRALQSVFYKAITLCQPTGVRYLVALDVNSSMFNNLNGAPLLMSSVWAAAAMSVGILRREASCRLLALTGSAAAMDIGTKDLTVEQLCEALEKNKKDEYSNLMSLISWATEKKEAADAIVIFTNQTRFNEGGKLVDVFRKYCKDMNLPSARLVIVSFSKMPDFPDMDDASVLLLRGLDPSTPEVIHSFVSGKLDS